MSRSVTYRERETDREWEETPKRSYTTVKRYQVPESSTRSSRYDDEDVKERIVIKRSDRREPSRDPPREDIDVRITERVREAPREDYDYRVTERVRERPRGDDEESRFTERVTERDSGSRGNVTYRVVERDSDNYSHAGRSDYRTEYKTVERQSVRAPSPPEERIREFRFERERSISPEPRERHRERDRSVDVEHYHKSTEYFAAPQPAPQPIIIRESAPQPPIIIREERRDAPPIIIREERRAPPRFEFIERETVTEDKALVKREESPPSSPSSVAKTEAKSTKAASTVVAKSEHKQEDEDYFYERRIREVDRRRHDDYDRRSEVHPRESASNYSSDDSYEYIRRERTYDDRRGHSPHHKRHLAEGVIAGIGAAEVLRHHRKSEGRNPGGRVKSALGGAAVGALGAEAITRFRSRSRRRESRSRSRSWSEDRSHRRRHQSRSRSRSRSKSISRKQLGGLAAVAAVGALAGYALKNRNKNQETVIVDNPPRSRSRRRRGSPDAYAVGDVRDHDKHRDPHHRNRRIAQAGLASAAAAGIWERVRSKSRHRSKSRVRTGVPVAAAGLGGAALAGLYEKNKASKEAKRDAMVEDELNRGRRRSSRSRSRTRSVPPSEHNDDLRRGPPVDDQGMIAYGNEPVPPDQQRGYSSDEAPGMYRRRHRGGSSASNSPDNRHRSRSRSRSRARNTAEAGVAGAAAGALPAYDMGARDGRGNWQRRDHDRYNEPYSYGNGPGQYSPQPGYHPSQNYGYPDETPYGQPQGYPQGHYFPPPPTGEQAFEASHNQPYPEHNPNPVPSYNPADYGPGGAQQPPHANPYTASRGLDDEAGHGAGAPPPGDGQPGDEQPPGDQNTHGPPNGNDSTRRRDNSENVSSTYHQNDVDRSSMPVGENELERGRDAGGINSDGQRTPRPRSTSRVHFDFAANEEYSPERQRRQQRDVDRHRHGSDTDDHRPHRRHHRNGNGHRHRRHSHDSPSLMNDRYERSPSSSSRSHHNTEGDGNESDSTVDLPARFDTHGNRKSEQNTDLGSSLSELILGRGGQGGLLSSFLGGAGDHGSERRTDGRDGRHRSSH